MRTEIVILSCRELLQAVIPVAAKKLSAEYTPTGKYQGIVTFFPAMENSPFRAEVTLTWDENIPGVSPS